MAVTLRQQIERAMLRSGMTEAEVTARINAQMSLEDKKITISYRPSWDLSSSKDEILARLKDQRDMDIHMLTTTSGPHRDRFILSDQNGIFTNSASTGQMFFLNLIQPKEPAT